MANVMLVPAIAAGTTAVMVAAPRRLIPATVAGTTVVTTTIVVLIAKRFYLTTVVGTTVASIAGERWRTYDFTTGIGMPLTQPDPELPQWYVEDMPDSTTGLTRALRPPTIPHLGSTELGWSFDGVAGTGAIWITASSEANYDYLRLWKDDVSLVARSGTETKSSRFTFPVVDGLNDFRFTFSKDESFSNGQDTAYIFRVEVPFTPNLYLFTAKVAGSTEVDLTTTVSGPLRPDPVLGSTAVEIHPTVDLWPELVYSQNTTAITLTLRGVLEPDPVLGWTAAHISGDIVIGLDSVRGKTAVVLQADTGIRWLIPHVELGTTYVRIINRPVLRANTPILLAFSARTRIESIEPDRVGGQKIRSVAGVVLTMPEPAVSDGRPSLPDYWAGHRADGSASGIGASANLIQGPLHIHSIPDPNPVWDPRTGGWSHPPPNSGGGDLRWTVDTLPDPNAQQGGWYWLGQSVGDPSTHAHVNAQWHTAPGSIADVYFDSFYPFRPSVNSYNGYIPGERTVAHAKGVHFNSHYIEHMWADFGQNQNQPFTWVVVATVMSDPFPGYQHTILDAGRNPDSVGFPHISAGATSTERRFADNLPYRTRLAWGGETASMQTSEDAPVRAKAGGGYHPRMFISVFDGENSQVGMWDPFGKAMGVGRVAGGPAFSHRYLTLGREQGWLSQRHAANILVFEMRYWMHALTREELESQYAQLSSTHQFDAYRHL